MDNEMIERIKEMERLYDEASAAVANFDEAFGKFLDAQEAVARLEDYLESGAWMTDFEADEAGELPSDLKRGVLSEDGLFDLLDENDFELSFITLPPSEE